MKRNSYLTVTVDYALGCAGTCPSCVLTDMERTSDHPATTPELVAKAMTMIAPAFGPVETLALGIGRANVLALGEERHSEVVRIVEAAKDTFDFVHAAAEISTSLIGKVDVHVDKAVRLMDALEHTGFDVRFVVVGNTSLVSAKYWRNLETFLRSIEARRGGAGVDGAGDILQLSLAIATLPPVEELVARVRGYKFPINLLWTPAFDEGARSEDGLRKLENWLAEFYLAAARDLLDSSLNIRVDQVSDSGLSGVADYVGYLQTSLRSIAYIAPNGSWHEGLFTVLAEMDPVRFDPGLARTGEHGKVIADPAREIMALMRNPACKACSHVGDCVAGGTYRMALTTLRRHPGGTTACPAAIRRTFEIARMQNRRIRGRAERFANA